MKNCRRRTRWRTVVFGLMTISTVAPAATVYWDIDGNLAGAGGVSPAETWNATNTFWNALSDGTGAVAAWTAGDIAAFSAGTDAAGAFTVTVEGTQSIGGLLFEEGQVTLSGGELAIAADADVSVANGIEAVVSSSLSGSSDITKIGAGTLVLSGESAGFTGALVLNEGTLRAIGSTSTTSNMVLGNGTLEFNSGVLHLMNDGPLNFGRAVTLGGDVTIIPDRINSSATDTTFTFGTLNVTNSAELTLSRGGNVTGSVYGRSTFGATTLGANLSINLSTVYSIVTLGTLSESVAGRSLTLTGGSNSTSILILNGASTLTGGFTINSGRVYASVANSLGPAGSTTTVKAGNLELRNANSAAGSTLVYDGTATLSLIHNNTTVFNVAGFTHNGGTLTLTSGRSSSTNFTPRVHTFSNDLPMNGNLVLNPSLDTTLVLTGVISELSGSRVVTKSGVGIVRLEGLSTYSGTTTLSNGVLQVGINEALPSGAGKGNFTMNPGTGVTTVFDLNGFQQTINGLSNSGVGTSVIDNTALGEATLTIGAADGTGVFSGILQSTGGALNLVKSGAGTITLSGANTQTGTITVGAGVLQFSQLTALYNGSVATWTAANLTIQSGGTLALNVGGTGEFGTSDLDVIAALGSASGGFQSGSFLGLDTTNAGGSFTYSADIADTNGGANAFGLLKSGAGTLVLEGTSTYSGGTVVAAGTLSIAADANLGATGGTLTLSNGTLLQVTGTNSPVMNRAVSLTGTSTLEVSEAANTLTLTSDFAPGGTLTKTGAGMLRLTGTVTSNSNVVISAGRLAAAGTVNTGAGTTTLGSAGAMGSLLLESGSSFTTTTLAIGTLTNYEGVLVNRGGSLTLTTPTASAGIGLGSLGYGGLFMSSGTISTNRVDSLDGPSAASIAIVQISGGTLNTADYIMFRNEHWEFTITGGEVQRNAQHIALGFRSGSSSANATTTAEGAMTVAGGLVNNAGFLVTMGQQNSDRALGTTHLNLNAGTLITNQMLHYNGTGSATKSRVNFNGGTLRASVNTTLFLGTTSSGGSGVLNAYVNGAFGSFAGGAVIDSNGFNITIPAALQAPTGDGVSSIAVTSAGSGYVGAPYVEITGGGGSGATASATVDLDPTSGTYGQVLGIVVTNPGIGYTSAPTVTLLGGGGSGAVIGTVSTAANTSGGLTKTGEGTLTLSGLNTYSGGTTINAGTLALGADDVLPVMGPVTIDGGTLDVSTFSNTVGTVTLQSGAITSTTGELTSTSAFELQGGSVGAILAGAVGLNKTTSGTVVLSGANTFTGAVSVTGGVLSFDAAENLGAGSSVIVNGGTLSYSGSGTLDVGASRVLTFGAAAAALAAADAGGRVIYSGGISPASTGALTKTGAGTVMLTGSSDLNSAAVTVSEGVLQAGFGSDGIGALTIHAGTVMDFRNDAAEALGGLSTLSIGNGARLVFELDSMSGDSLAVLPAAAVTGTITLDFSSVGSGVSEMTYNLISAGSGLSLANFVLGDGIAGWNLSLSSSDTLISLTAIALQTRYWRGGTDFSWSTLGNWSTDTAGLVAATQIPGSASSVFFSASTAPFSSGTEIINTLDGAFTIDSLHFESTPSGITAITLNPGTGGALTLAPQSVAGGIEVKDNAGTIEIAAPVVAETPQTWDVSGTGAALEVSGSLTFTSVVTKAGAGSLTLSGGNSGAGGLMLSGGTLNLNSASALGTGLLTIGSGVTIDNKSGAPLVLSGGTFQWAGDFVFMGANDLNLGSGSVSLANTVTVDTTAGNLTVGGVIGSGSDDFGLVKIGAGTLTLGGINTYLGGTVLDQGTLVYTASQNGGALTFGAAQASTNVGTLDLSAASATFAGPVLVQTNSTNYNTVTIGAGQTLRFDGSFVVGFDSGVVTRTRLAISGEGTFKIGDAGAPTNASVQVGNSTTTSISNPSVLDMSGLSTFYANLGTGIFRIGDTVNGGGGAGSGGGGSAVLLAENSTLIAATISLDSPTLATQTLSLGTGTNLLQANNFYFGGVSARGQSVVNFISTTGTLVMRNLAGDGRAVLNVQNGGAGTAGTLTGFVDLTGHHSDLLLSSLGVGGRSAGTGIGTGTFIFDTGILDATTVTIASRTSGSVTTNNITGTVTLGGTTAGTSVILGTVTMATNTSSSATSSGNAVATLNISGIGTTSIDTLNMGVLGLTGASAGTGAANGTTATVNISGSTTTLGAVNMAVNSSTATGATTATSAFNITAGTVNVTGGINMGGTSGNALNVVNNTLSVTGGTLAVGGDIAYSDGVGVENIAVTLDGGTVEMNSHEIGSASAPIAFNAQSGTLRNLAELNGGDTLTKTTAGVLIFEGVNSHSGGTTVSDGTVQVGTLAAAGSLTGSGTVTVVKTGATLATAPVLAGGANGSPGSGIITGSVIVGDLASNANTGVLAVGFDDTTMSNTTLIIQGAGGLTVAGGSQLQLSITTATANDSGILAALAAGSYTSAADYIAGSSPSWTDGAPASLGDYDFIQIIGGLQLGTRNGGGTVAILDNGYLANAQSGDVFNLLDWSGVMSGSFTTGSGFSAGGAHGDFDLPTLSGGLMWDTSAFSTAGVIVVVPEPGLTHLLLIGLAVISRLRRRPSCRN
ncbi:MAG: autotransporter-associated beta strand repeat-containing protein [Prosthecobacter sp.]